MDCHLVAVEIRIEGSANERMDLDGFAFYEHGFECLDAQTVKGWGAVEQHRMVLNDLFQDVPNHGLLQFHHFFCLLDGGAVALLFEAVIDERLEEFERHLLGQAALMQLQFGTDHDDGTTRVINAFAEQVLAEAALFALQGVAE